MIIANVLYGITGFRNPLAQFFDLRSCFSLHVSVVLISNSVKNNVDHISDL